MTIAHRRAVMALGLTLGFAMVAAPSVRAADQWTITRSPASVGLGATMDVTVVVSTPLLGPALACVDITIPPNVKVDDQRIIAQPLLKTWSIDQFGASGGARRVRLRANSDSDRMVGAATLRARITVTGKTVGTSSWHAEGFGATNCSSPRTPTYDPSFSVTGEPASPTPVPSPSPSRSPTPTPTRTPRATPSPTATTPAVSARPSSSTGPASSPGAGPLGSPPGSGDGAAGLGIPNAFGIASQNNAELVTSLTGFDGILTWAVPSLALTVPGILLLVAIGAQMGGGLAWLPVARSKLGSSSRASRRARRRRARRLPDVR